MTDAALSTDIDQRLVRAIGHPLRQRILRRLQEQTASPTELAKAFGEPVGRISYHVRVLLDNQAIELVRTRPVRGAVEHFYRPLVRPFFDDEHWAQLPAAARQALFGQTLTDIFGHAAHASTHGGFDDPKSHASWTPLELDDLGHARLTRLLGDLLDNVAELQAETLGRLAGEPSIRRTELAIMHFDRKPRPPE